MLNNLTFEIKMIPTKYVTFGDKTFTCADALCGIDEILSTKEDASVWDGCLYEYDIDCSYDFLEFLIKENLCTRSYSDNMSRVYHITENSRKTLERLQKVIQEFYYDK